MFSAIPAAISMLQLHNIWNCMLQLYVGSNQVPILFRLDNSVDNYLAKGYRASLCGSVLVYWLLLYTQLYLVLQ